MSNESCFVQQITMDDHQYTSIAEYQSLTTLLFKVSMVMRRNVPSRPPCHSLSYTCLPARALAP